MPGITLDPATQPSSPRCSPSSATLVMTVLTLSALTCTGFVFLLGASNGEELFGEPTP